MGNEVKDEVVIAVGVPADKVSDVKRFFSSLKNINAAIVVIQQMDARSKSLSCEELQSFTHIPVERITPESLIKAGKIYLAPSHQLISLNKGHFVIQEITENVQKLATIDWFMNSVAQFKERAIGILLDHDSVDGSLGLKIIRENGGLTILKKVESDHPILKKKSDFIDHVLSLEEMATFVDGYLKVLEKFNKKRRFTHLEVEIEMSLKDICEILLRHTHHDFQHYKSSTMTRRIQRRMLVRQIEDVESYVAVLDEEKKERDALFNDLLINVTSFFRDSEAFELVKDEVLLPELQKLEGNKKYRIWVAGCSTGEEAYTLAILAQEVMNEIGIKRDVQIIATDIDEEALNTARKGEYPLSISDKVSKERLDQFFQSRDGKFVINRKLREMILFSSHNLVMDPPFSQVDLITCRNVLIYLGPQLQKKLLPLLHYSLRPNGYLFLGISEVLGTHKDLFNPISLKYRLAQRKTLPVDQRSPHLFQSVRSPYKNHLNESAPRENEDVHLAGQKIVFEQFDPKFAIIGSEGQIISLSAGIQDYLEPNEGLFQNNILKLVLQNLRSPLRTALNDCKKKKELVENHSSIIKDYIGVKKVGITVQLMPPSEDYSELYLVVFRDLGYITDHEDSDTNQTGEASLVEELEHELVSLREELDKSIQDLEASNEELKSSNEELLSMNEELQSVNEELEISKEEIQRGNEILLNSNVELENLLNSTKIATIFLDDDLKIKNFTPYISEIYDLRPQDIGRSIDSFNSKAVLMPKYTNPTNLGLDRVIETEVIMPDGRVFLRRKSAYLNKSRKKIGLVVTFVDVTALRRSEEMFRSLANTVPQMIWSTDEHGNYLYFSDQWFEYTGLDPATIKNFGFRDILHPDDYQRTIETWENIRKTKDYFNFEYRLRDKHGVYQWHLLMARSLRDANGKIYRWFGTCTNIQERKNQELQLRASRLELIRNQERFNNVASAINLGVWYSNLPFGVLNWSDTVKRHFWCEGEDAITLDFFFSRIHADDRNRVRDSIDKAIYNHEHYDENFRTVDPETRHIKWIRSIGWADYADDGTPVRFDGVTFEITEELRSYDALKDREWRYAMASKATRELIWDWDLLTNNIEWSESLTTEYGYPEKEQTKSSGQWWIDHVHPDDRDRVNKGIDHAIKNKLTHWTDEYRFLKADGTYAHVLDRGYVQINDNNQPIRMIGTMYDQTETNNYLSRMENAIKARDEFLSIASHELKTPLTSMVLQMQMLKRKMDRGQADGNDFLKANNLTLKQCQLLTSLIDDMLDVSRISNGKMNFAFKDTSLKEIVATALESFSVNVEERKIPLKLEVLDDSIIKADPFRLEQVFYNLLSNALKYGENKPIEVRILRRNDFAVVEVRDQGMGIGAENIERIFKLFERATSSTSISGLGLGLYISKQIVDAHNGTLEVESKEHEGSVFRVVIPISKAL